MDSIKEIFWESVSGGSVAERPRCCSCGQAMRLGEPQWAGDKQGRPWHYGCAEKAGLTFSWFVYRRPAQQPAF